MAVTSEDTEAPQEDLDSILADADRYLREVLPARWVDAVDRNDFDAAVDRTAGDRR